MNNMEKLENIRKSYVTKEELLKLINDIDFILVNSCDLELITGFELKKDKDLKDYFSPLYKTVKID